MAVAATGFFDGVHIGHRRVLSRLVELASQRGEESLVVTFWPHPRTVLQDDARSLRLLNSLEEKKLLLKSLGVGRVEVLDFSRDFSRLTTEEYLRMLRDRFGVTAVVLGYDNRIGSDLLPASAAASIATSLGLHAELLGPVLAPGAPSAASLGLHAELLGPVLVPGAPSAAGPVAAVPASAAVPAGCAAVTPGPSSPGPGKQSSGAVPADCAPVIPGSSSPGPTQAGLTVPKTGTVDPLFRENRAYSPEIMDDTPTSQVAAVIPSATVSADCAGVIPGSDRKALGAVAISSTKIRAALAEGRVEDAAAMLGYRYMLHGVVVSGNHLGRTLGFPTANMQLYEPLKQLPGTGVYSVEVTVLGRTFRGMTNIGTRPTVSGRPSDPVAPTDCRTAALGVIPGPDRESYAHSPALTIETNIFDFDEDIYGLDLRIRFRRKIRDERRFPSLSALSAQLASDRASCLE